MADFGPIVNLLLSQHGVTVHKWRKSMTGCAWSVRYTDGRVENLIECPRPRTPLSLAIVLHEIGHHAIGFDAYPTRCEEELHAWQWALTQMEVHGVPPDERTQRRFRLSMEYAVDKAVRRGIKALPETLRPFLPRAA